MSTCFTCNEPLHSCTCVPSLQCPTEVAEELISYVTKRPECGEATRNEWEEKVAELNNRFRRLSEKELSGEERPASEGVTRGLRWGSLALLYGRGGGKSIAAELMLLIEIARAAVKYRGPATVTERMADARRLDTLLAQFKKLDGE